MALVQVVLVVGVLVIELCNGQDYGPVNLDTVDPLSLSWNQIHSLVKDQIKEVEELKAEHDEIYNEITGCYGLEKCLAEFDLLDINPGSKLWSLGLRKMDLSMSSLTRQREEVVQTQIRLDAEMRERQRQLLHQEEMKMKTLEQQRLELQRQTELERHKMEAAKALLETNSRQSTGFGSGSGSSSSSSSSWSTSSSSYSRNSGGGFAQGRPSVGQTPWGGNSFFSNTSTIYGQKPQVYERRYEYSSKQKYGSFQPPQPSQG
eukprot:TRINITY_DN5935_c0_g1_i3.p1 TRINITY_DN5935_c0_g1~~TRINITY_DN5935_c0_g1_i3.p1  ORF type:complete len:261 (-),score=64.31 TRINITY_DN5935_c0_g1_i3:87-869(-)